MVKILTAVLRPAWETRCVRNLTGLAGSDRKRKKILTGFAAVWGTIRFVQTRTFAPFVGYRFVVGAGVIALAVAGFNS